MCFDAADSIKNARPELSVEQKKFMNLVTNSINHLENNHYEIALPFRDSDVLMPNNREQAEKRARCLQQKFTKNQGFYKDYQAFVNEMLEKGFAEKIHSSLDRNGKVWYLPHHGVYHPEKPNKIRVVFDASCKYKESSLNQNLLPGPDITNTLLGVLLRFRKECVAIQGDIQGMFHQVQVPPSDRDFFRFLWWKDGDINQPLEEYRMALCIALAQCAHKVVPTLH